MTRRLCLLASTLLGISVVLGCGARLDPKWADLPPLAEAPGSEQDAEIRELRQTVEAKPDSGPAKRALATALVERGRLDEAAAVVAALLSEDPLDDRAAATLLGMARLFNRAPPFIGSLCQQILSRDPDNRGALWVLGEMLLDQNQMYPAKRVLSRAWQPGREHWLVALALGRLSALQARRQEAKDWLNRAAAIAPDTREAKLGLARAYLDAGDAERAAATAREAVAMGPTNPEAQVVLGAALLASRRMDEAISALEEAIALADQPDSAASIAPQAGVQRARWLLGRAYAQVGKYDKARDLLEQAADQNWGPTPPPPTVNMDLALVHQQLQDHTAAIEQYQLAIQGNLDSVDAYNNLAYLYAEEGEHLDEAIELAQLAVDLAPSHVTYDTLGWAYYQSGQHAEAAEHLAKAEAQKPDEPEILRHLALAKSRLGGHDEALRLLRSARRLSAGNPGLRARIEQDLVDVQQRAARGGAQQTD